MTWEMLKDLADTLGVPDDAEVQLAIDFQSDLCDNAKWSESGPNVFELGN